MKKVILLLAVLLLTSCGVMQKAQQAPVVNEFDILRLRIMERMAGNENSN